MARAAHRGARLPGHKLEEGPSSRLKKRCGLHPLAFPCLRLVGLGTSGVLQREGVEAGQGEQHHPDEEKPCLHCAMPR